MAKTNKRFLLVLSVTLLFLISGCAEIYVVTPTLKYSTVMPKRPLTDISINVADFKDMRPNKGSGTLGPVSITFTHYNGIMEPPDISQWVTSAFKDELRNAGYGILDKEGSLKIEGEILDVAASYNCAYEGTVVFKMRIRQGDNLLLDNNYRGTKRKQLLLSLTLRQGSEEVLTESLQEAIKQAIVDIDKILKK